MACVFTFPFDMRIMDVFSSWLAKLALTHTANAVYRRCVDSGLLAKCSACAEEWRRQLPPDATLHSIEMFFRSDSANGIDSLPPGPKNVLASIDRGEVPTRQTWLDDLLTQWKWVRDNVEEPTEFFTLEEQIARTRLDTLATILYGECTSRSTSAATSILAAGMFSKKWSIRIPALRT